MDPLDGCYLKFSRALAHLNALNEAVQEFQRTDAATIVPELNQESGEVVLRVKLLHDAPLEWAITIGEIAHNLRSCLDHLAWQLALTQVGNPYDKTEFPIFTKRNLYNREGPSKVRDLSSSQKAFVEGLQPYHMGDDAESHPLWLLHELNNTDKHRLLPVASLAVVYGDPAGELGLWVPGVGSGTPGLLEAQITLHINPGTPMENGAKLATIKILEVVSLHKQVQVYAKVSSNMFFGVGIKANSGRRIDQTLQAIFQHVEQILVDCKARFFT